MAERCDGRFQGRVAVKLLNTALVGRAGEERFRREGTILARLRHPRIAHLIDAGVSPTGQPYLVLEHVDGQWIDRYCEDRVLAIDVRLRLFLEVLEGVAHAHASLIVHRDIKPANVLVSTDGHVKLLDFGIDKLIERDPAWDVSRAEAGALTREGGAPLTPEYAAPEQLSGGAVTTATDVYALGVLLYGLLSGQHPAGRARRSPATLVRAIVEVEPPRVSDAVASQRESPEALSRHARQHHVKQAASAPSGRSRHRRRKGAEEERRRALLIGYRTGRRPPARSPPRADQRAAGYASVSGLQVCSTPSTGCRDVCCGCSAVRRVDRDPYQPALGGARSCST
jgi:serine/threonine protein kinase